MSTISRHEIVYVAISAVAFGLFVAAACAYSGCFSPHAAYTLEEADMPIDPEKSTQFHGEVKYYNETPAPPGDFR